MDYLPVKTLGAYKIAAQLRNKGYKVKVINHFMHLYENHSKEFLAHIKSIIKKDAKFFGFSGTFLNNAGNGDNYVSNKKHEFDHLKFSFTIRYLRLHCPNIPIIMGGNSLGARILYEKNKNIIDHYIEGLAESSILKFLEEDEPKKIFIYDMYASKYDFRNSLPSFSEEDIIMPNEVLPIELSRGCKFKCKFCAYSLIGKDPKDLSYIRCEESIYNEMKHNYDNFGITKYFIMCDTFNESTEKIETLCRVKERLGFDIKFWCYLRIDLMYTNPIQVDLLKEAGLSSAFFGLETLNPKSAKTIGKNFNRDKVKWIIQKTKDTIKDVFLQSSFIIGLPHDNKENTEEWLQKYYDENMFGIDFTQLSPLKIDSESNSNALNKIWLSDMEKDPAKYGYKFYYNDQTNHADWYNEHWTKNECRDLVFHWRQKFLQKDTEKKGFLKKLIIKNSSIPADRYNILDSFNALATENIIGYDEFKKIISQKNEQEFYQIKNKYINEYWKKNLEYESNN